MEPSKEMFRFYVYTELQRGLTAKVISDQLTQVWHEKAPHYATVCRWYNKFSTQSTFTLSDSEKSGRPTSVCSEENVNLLKSLIEDDEHLSIRDLNDLTDISIGSIHHILRDILGLRTVFSSWVPYSLTENVKQQRVQCATSLLQLLNELGSEKYSKYAVEDETFVLYSAPPSKRHSRVWIRKDEKRPQEVSSRLTTRKTMLLIAFSPNRRISIDALPYGDVLDSERYIEFLKATGDKWRHLHSSPIHLSEIYWQHDNARCHVSLATSTFCACRGMHLVKQSPYSPDLNLCDRWLNALLKEHLQKISFESAEQIKTAAEQFLRHIPLEDFTEQVSKLERHCQRVIIENGNFVTD